MQTDRVDILRLSHDGRGVARYQGKTLFLDNALPGEQVHFQIKRHKKRYSEGLATEILKSSPDRVTPPCHYAHQCGGCTLQHLSPSAQIAYKENVVLEHLSHIAGVKPKHRLPPIQGEPLHYRRRARLGCRYVEKKQEVLVGFREKHKPYITNIDRCEILETVGELITPLKQLIQSLQAFREIPQIEVAVGENQTALVLRVLGQIDQPDIEKLMSFSKQHQVAFYLQTGGVETLKPLSPDISPLSYTLKPWDLTLNFGPNDFVQINGIVNEKLIAQVIEHLFLESHHRVLDLFCGLGNFTLPIAQQVQEVVGVEGSQALVTKAKLNAQQNRITNTHFHTIDLNQLTQPFEVKGSFDRVLLDPPRTGAEPCLNWLAKLTNHIIYVSCEPTTLARDVKSLVNDYGFVCDTFGVIDMFPHTTHVETFLVLKK